MSRRKSSLVFGTSHPLTGNWDPYSHAFGSQVITEGWTHSLLFRHPDTGYRTEDLVPELALSQRLIDPFTLEYRLREGVRFHDGKQFDAEDVKATVEFANRRESRRRSLYPSLADVEIVDRYTVRISTEEYGYPASSWWFVVTLMPVVSARDLENPKMLSERPNGTGPFIFRNSGRNTFMFEVNPEYFGGRSKLDQVVYRLLPDATTREVALRTGEVDLIDRVDNDQVSRLQGNSNYKLEKNVSVGNKFLFFRCCKPPFDDYRLRRAACHAIDRSRILEIMGEAGCPTGCHITPRIWGYTDKAGLPDYDPTRCRELLAECGYPGGKGLPGLEYIISLGYYPGVEQYGEAITAMLCEQGFPVKLTKMDMAQWINCLFIRQGFAPGHMIDSGWSTGSPEPDLTIRGLFHSSNSTICGVEDQEINTALDRERGEVDLNRRRRLLERETFPLLAERVPALPLFTGVNIHAMVRNLEHIRIGADGRLYLEEALFT